jgi:4-amino-4-deoxy-L-arabinose transferase-like glycosyltransferase
MMWTFVAIAFFACLGRSPLSDNNEGLYAAIAADMLRTSHFIVPQLGGMPYIEKPPLLYWLMATSFALFGETAFAARLVPALAALGTCVVLFTLLRGLNLKREAHICVLVFASSLGVVVLARLVLFDMLLVFGLTLALAGLCSWGLGGGHSRASLRIAAAGLGLAILAKGFVAAVLLGAIVGVMAFIDRRYFAQWWRAGADPIAVAILFALILPWHVLAAWQQRDFTTFYFINEHLLRFLGLREPHDYHQGPWYFYLPRLLLSMLPWVWTAPALALVRPDAEKARLECLLLVWTVVPLVFFSLSQAKADYYIVVCLPPMAAWIALRLGRLNSRGWRTLATCAVATAVLNLLIMAVLPVAAAHNSGRLATALPLFAGNGPLALAIAAALVAAPLCAAALFQTRYRLTALGMFGLPTLVTLLSLSEVARAAAGTYSGEPLARLARRVCGDASLLVYASPEAVSAVLFYWQGQFSVVDSSSADFNFAEHHPSGERRIFFDSRVLARTPSEQPLCLIVPTSELAKFGHSALLSLFSPIARTGTGVLWGNRLALARSAAARSLASEGLPAPQAGTSEPPRHTAPEASDSLASAYTNPAR